MSVHIDNHGRLHHDQEQHLAVTCSHCEVFSHITPIAVPQYEQLIAFHPKQVGIVFRCDSCNAPVFLRFNVKMYAANRVELATTFVELERAREKFSFTYLPEEAEALFKEALTAYSAAAFNAFASMCRRVAQATFTDLGPQARLELFDELANIRRLAELDDDAYELVRKVLFDFDEPGRDDLPKVDPFHAGVLLEVLKDLLYQAYVRRGRLQQAMMVRRYFAEDAANVTPLPGTGA